MLIKMDWTSLYLKTANLNVFILGTGEVATRRAKSKKRIRAFAYAFAEGL